MNSRTTPEFWQLFNALPKEVQRLAYKNYRLWMMDQSYPSLHFKPFKRNLWCVRIGSHYRATGVFLDNETFRWTWIGTHEEYNKLR